MQHFPFFFNTNSFPPIPIQSPFVSTKPNVPNLRKLLINTMKNESEKYYGAYRVDELIGEGNGTSIYKATCILDNKVYALKVMRNVTRNKAECEMHAQVPKGTDHVVSYVEYFTEAPFLVLVMELFSRNLLGIEISPMRLLNIFLHTAKGMSFIDSLGCSHDDLKPENMYFKGGVSKRIAIGDFGGVRRKGEPCKEHTAPYCAPEQIDGIQSNDVMVYGWATSMEKIITGRVGVCRGGQSLSNYTPWVGTFFDPLIALCTNRAPFLRPRPSEVLIEVQRLARIAQNDMCSYHDLPRFGCLGCMECHGF